MAQRATAMGPIAPQLETTERSRGRGGMWEGVWEGCGKEGVWEGGCVGRGCSDLNQGCET